MPYLNKYPTYISNFPSIAGVDIQQPKAQRLILDTNASVFSSSVDAVYFYLCDTVLDKWRSVSSGQSCHHCGNLILHAAMNILVTSTQPN